MKGLCLLKTGLDSNIANDSNKIETPYSYMNQCFNCIYFNAQSLKHKMSELLVTVEARKPDVIGITETWGVSDISDSEFSIP